MRHEAKILLEKSTDSLLLSVQSFNSPWNRGRNESVLIFLDRAFELLLKSIIVFKGKKIRSAKSNQTIGFDNCVRKCVSDNKTKCITEEQALTMQIINSLRDAAQHHIIDISEQQLYIYCQSAVTLYSELLNKVFEMKLTDFRPERVLPISANPPQTLDSLLNYEFNEIKELVKEGKRKTIEAYAKLRSFAIVEDSISGKRTQPTEIDMTNIITRIKKNEPWHTIFPAIKSISIDDEGNGFALSLKITKNEGNPVYLVPEGTPGATVIAVKRVNELSYYNLGLRQLASKLKLTMPKALAVIKELKINESEEYYKEIKISNSKFKRYSAKAVEKVKQEIGKLDMVEVWTKQRPRHRLKGSS
jgi:hypothetical protein